ncbi:MAG TPA: hypothetical protein VLJ39_21230 [Tepidisphaeraceae bacterium]|nr:hypothetical protein [Tepidisphaeraceae bacterium]
MEPTDIGGLRADIVPHRQWAISRWFYANPLWYYHRPSAAHEIHAGSKFYQLIDPELRELCRLLNESGLRTTPSCQGHSYQRDRFERIWDELTREQEAIRARGLLVKDCENDRPYLFQDNAYRIPWQSFGAFYSEANAHQNCGYLGILVPQGHESVMDRLQKSLQFLRFTSVRTEADLGPVLGGTLLSVRVSAPNPQTRSAEWRQCTEFVRASLVGCEVGPAGHPRLSAPYGTSRGNAGFIC